MTKGAMVDAMEANGTCKSRSTSAGSSKHSSSIGTDSLAQDSVIGRPRISEMTYPSPFVMRNTFLDHYDHSPSSLVDFFQAREIQSCPTSGISAPPGLEQFGSSVESEAGESDFVPVKPGSLASANKVAGLPEIEYPPPFVVRNIFLDTSNPEQMLSVANSATGRQAKSCPEIVMGLPPGLSNVSCEDFGGFASDLSHDRGTAGLAPGSVLAYQPVIPHLQHRVPPPPIAAPCVVPPRQLAPTMATAALPPSPMCVPQLYNSEVLQEPVWGTPDMPTFGSAWHRLGTCKPCAFMHTKGCGSGVECEFCHLCAPGEKKRRKKTRHAVARVGANLTSHGMSPPAAAAMAAAGNWAFAHSATDATSMYRL